MPAIIMKQIGRNLNVKIGKLVVTKTGIKEELEPIKKDIERYNKLKDFKSNVAIKLKDKIIAQLQAKQKKLEEELEREKATVKIERKAVKKEIKETINSDKERLKAYKKYLNPNIFEVKDEEVYKKGFPVKMPELLVDRIIDFTKKKISILPLLNFWDLCLLNPNTIARTKLFDYLNLHNLIVTPSGYFVTYRMVKKTDNPNIFTSARTHKEVYKIGEIFKLDRATECDEDGNRECSRGLHTGSPKFIGILTEKSNIDISAKDGLGDGYGITTKTRTNDSYGTGYDRPALITEKFDESHGNQAVICLVNPMHVVSIPNSDTRKMRSCEIYFAALTTPEEVIEHLKGNVDVYTGHDKSYKAIERKEIEKMLKSADLTDHFKRRVTAKSKLEALNEKLAGVKISNDKIASDVNFEQFKEIIYTRNITLK